MKTKGAFSYMYFFILFFSFAHATQVTFSVDMSNITANPEGVYVVGGGQYMINEEQNLDGNPTGWLMNDSDGDDIWEVVVPIPFGETVTYKFRNAPCDNWDDCGGVWEDQLQDCGVGEWYDRELTVDQEGEMSAGLYCFNTCDLGECGAPPETVPITFVVDMSIIGSHSTGVYLVGGNSYLQGPLGILMDDSDGDELWEVTVDLPPGTYTFKFRNGECATWDSCPQEFWEDFGGECGVGEWGDREITVASQSFTYGPYCFDMCQEGECSTEPVEVEFQVEIPNDLLSQAEECGVYIYGNFNGFDIFVNALEMDQVDASNVFTFSETFSPGDYLTYKYSICMGQSASPETNEGVAGCGTSFGGDCSGGSSDNMRAHTVPYIDTILPMDYYDACPGYARVILSVDMSEQIISGNGVCVAGGTMPNGPIGTELCDPDGDDVFSTVLSFPYDSHQTYKFINGCGTTWENPGFEELPEDCTEGTWNDRYFDVYTDNQSEGPHMFGECSTLSNSEELYLYDYKLSEPYPNPFNPSTTISYLIDRNTNINISIYNMVGEKVSELVNTKQAAGEYSVSWEANNQPSGLYLVMLSAGNQIKTQKIMLVK